MLWGVENLQQMLINVGRGKRSAADAEASGGRGRLKPPSFERLSIYMQHALLSLDEVRRIDRLTTLPLTSKAPVTED